MSGLIVTVDACPNCGAPAAMRSVTPDVPTISVGQHVMCPTCGEIHLLAAPATEGGPLTLTAGDPAAIAEFLSDPRVRETQRVARIRRAAPWN